MLVPAASAAAFPGDNGLVVFSSNRIVGDEPTDEADEPITDFEIYSAPLDGDATQLTNNTVSISTEDEVETLAPIDDLWPAVSPDGSRIAFTRNYDPDDGSTDPDVYTMATRHEDRVREWKGPDGEHLGARRRGTRERRQGHRRA